MFKNKKIILAVVAIAILLALLMVVYFAFVNGNANQDLKEITVIVQIDEEKSYTVKTEGAFAIDALIELKEQKNSNFTFEFETGEFGAYITSVNGKIADSLKNEYFAFYLNGEYAALGISEQAILDGDQIKLVLEAWW
ncbi:MAG: DUF4430 domain-containing protein [Clostridia bacterium]|nr:DUF4430 domain-containing protein [Clostridia bacterium]